MQIIKPHEVRLSEHFLLSDFMGSSSIYCRGIPNVFEKAARGDRRLSNGEALATQILEPILAAYGPMSISYGFISPYASQATVTYQDPTQPSYHRWDKGAACDIVVHDWVASENKYFTANAPIMLAHAIDSHLRLPYSRMITYSESPYICVSAAREEIDEWVAGKGDGPRRAFYENRYEGKPKAKPRYINMRSDAARAKEREALEQHDLPCDWTGAGYPTYHGGGQRQIHHVRTSRYTMLTDWLYSHEVITLGLRNCPALTDKSTMEALRYAGHAYDTLLERFGVKRLSIIQGHLQSAAFDDLRKFSTEGPCEFMFVPPADRFGNKTVCGFSYSEASSWMPGVRLNYDAAKDAVRVVFDPVEMDEPPHDFK